MLAMLFATIAFSTSAMLPAIADIAVEMTPGDTNRAQIVVTSFMLGMGIGSFFVGPISDMFGRKTVVIAGLVIYAIAALYASGVTDIEYLLASRFAMGIGASSSRVVTLAMVRDLYAGREMARIMSFVMTVFVLGPVNTNWPDYVTFQVWNLPKLNTNALRRICHYSAETSGFLTAKCSTPSCMSPNRDASGAGCRPGLETGTPSTPE